MGGIGKTTLVKDIYQSEEISDMFEKRACVTVMRPFNCDELLKSLVVQFGGKEATDDLARYLLVLDDVSSTSEWDSIVQRLPKATTCCIIVTTREKNIAKHCSKDEKNIRKLNNLNHDDACILFSKKVFKESIDLVGQYPDLAEQVEPILRKCNGLPLAIVTIGGYLANRPKTTVEWRKLNVHISAELEMNPELGTIRTVIMKSYDGLPYNLKSCFLYMPIFREDQEVKRRRLVRRWTAEGYTQEARGKSAEEIADSYFMELISRSMLLPSQKASYSTNGIDSCQVHDVIREIGISKSMEENLVFTLEEGCSSNSQAKVRHLAINGNWKGDRSEFEGIVDISCVRSVTVFGECKTFFISDKMSLLRVLDLEDTTDLYGHHLKHIGKLLHLRYLSLKGCYQIVHLQDSVGNLRELLTLDVRGTRIIKLPKSIINLQNLRNLCAGFKTVDEDMSWPFSHRACLLYMFPILYCLFWCAPQLLHEEVQSRRDVSTLMCCHAIPVVVMRLDMHGVLVPRGMRKLKALRTLGVVNIARQGKVILRDIRGLTRLRKLAVTGVSKENGQELCSTVALSRLESLSIRSEGKPGLSGCLDGAFSFPKNLEKLKLYGNLVKLPEWIQGLKNLVKLKLRSCRISEHDAAIQVLGNLPNLASMHLLKKSFKGKEVHLNFCPRIFQSLVVLELGLKKRLKSVKFEGGATPKLELLKLYIPDDDISFLSGLQSLSCLKEVVLTGFYNRTGKMEYVRAELAQNPNRPVLKTGY